MAQQLNSVRDIIADYEQQHLDSIKKDLTACKKISDYVYGKTLNKHQQRHNNRFNNVVKAMTLFHIQKWRFTNFEHLYDVVRSVFLTKGHIGAYLTMYDTALRIGYNHKEQILPSKFVYLYGNKTSGPLGGATALYGQQWIDEHYDKDYKHRIKARWFADKFPNLPSWEIESILCIYANKFTLNMPY